MKTINQSTRVLPGGLTSRKNLTRRILLNWEIYLMALPGLILLLIFRYLPMYGIVVAFKDFNVIKGILMATKDSKMVQDFGILNDDYTLDAAGKPVQTLEQQMEVTWKICYEIMATPDSFKVRLFAKSYDWAYTQAQEAEKDADFTRNLLAVLPVDEEFLKVEQKLALSTFISEETTKFITGVRPIAEFDKFVTELKGKGLDEQTEALNVWYAKYKD